jgi:U4/U6 small nuclear ribonucleoprotein PRP31
MADTEMIVVVVTCVFSTSILTLRLRAFLLSFFFRPDLTIKKRRGGKRMRRLKERFEETAMMKQANTRAFSEQAGEYGDDAMGLTRGLLDTSGVRKNAEKRKMKQFDNKASRKRAAQMNAGTTKSGLESSVVFTPVQGMELVNPDANKDRVREANRKWFSDNAGFQSALPKK